MTDELKPCPFCGGKPYLANVAMVGCAYVVCTDCRMQSDDGGRERVVAAWNTRTDSIPSQDALIRAALEAAANGVENLGSRLGYVDSGVTGPVTTSKAMSRAIRALADNPDALAAIKAKAGVRG